MRARRALLRAPSLDSEADRVAAPLALAVALLVEPAGRDAVAPARQLVLQVDAPAARAAGLDQEEPPAPTAVGEPAIASHELALLAREPGDHDVDAAEAGAAAVPRAARRLDALLPRGVQLLAL